MTKKAQANIFMIIVWLIIILLVLGSGLGYFVTTMSGVAMNGLSGVEAFFIGNLILWFIIGIIIAVLWWGAR